MHQTKKKLRNVFSSDTKTCFYDVYLNFPENSIKIFSCQKQILIKEKSSFKLAVSFVDKKWSKTKV